MAELLSITLSIKSMDLINFNTQEFQEYSSQQFVNFISAEPVDNKILGWTRG